MDLMSLNAKLTNLLELKIKNNPYLDLKDSRDEFLEAEIVQSMKKHELIDRIVLENHEPIAFVTSTTSSALLGYLLTKSAKVKKYKYVGFMRYFLPIICGSAGAYLHGDLNVRKLFRLKENCRECYQLKVILITTVTPILKQFYLTSLCSWIGETIYLKNVKSFQRKSNETYPQLTKRILYLYYQHCRQIQVPRNLAIVFLFGSVISYLIAIEEQREFSIVFSKYFQDLMFEAELAKRGILIDKNSSI